MKEKSCECKYLNKRFSRKTTYRIKYEDNTGRTIEQNYIYLGMDKYHQKIFRPVKHSRTDAYDESLELMCPTKIVDLEM